MKKIILSFISVFYRAFIHLKLKGNVVKGCRFLFVHTNCTGSDIQLKNSKFKYVRLSISSGNKLECNNCSIEKSSISISGSNNSVIIESGVVLRSGELIIRGENCNIIIGKGTTFGGVRMISVGSNSSIIIGENCLFSDNIEIWSSDTHPIYDHNKEIINSEGNIIISDRVWVGSGAKILKNVTLGNDSIIGMATVVTKNTPASSISVGNPSRVVKEGISWQLEY